MAVHAVLIPGGAHGKILFFGGYLVDDTHIYDIDSNTLDSAAPLPGYNIFCSGHSFLSDGRILIAGGQLELYDENGQPIPAPVEGEPPELPTVHLHYNMSWGGERRCAIYYPLEGAWHSAGVDELSLDPLKEPNSGGRWYPTLCTLPNGEVLAVGGHPDLRESYPPNGPERHNNHIPERYNPTSNSWTLLGSHPPDDNQTTAHTVEHAWDYQRTHLLPTGLVFFSSPVRDKNRFYDSYEGRFLEDSDHVIDLPPLDTNDPHDDVYQHIQASFTSVLLPLTHQDSFRPRILLMGGSKAKRIDLTNPASAQWQNTTKRDWPAEPPARYFVSPVILPTGNIFFTGGTQAHVEGEDPQALCVLKGETYDPGIDWPTGQYSKPENWKTDSAQSTVGRHYHGVAILMPNGAVWTAGSNGPSDDPLNQGGRELRIQIYKPDYFQQSDRPVITESPKNIGYGFTFHIKTDQANSINRVVFLRCGSVTHAFNPDQRYVSVNFNKIDSKTLEVTVPNSPQLLPPGRYLLWIVDNQNRPCEWAPFIRISKQEPLITAELSTFSKSEIDALGQPANFPSALYIVYQGFLPDEVVSPTPSTPIWKDTKTEVPGMIASLGPPKYEGGFNNKDIAQNVVYPCHITFNNDDAFNSIPDDPGFRDIILKISMGDFPAEITLSLSKKLHPRMSDGYPHWLSIDLRTFSTKPGLSPYANLEHPAGTDAPYFYIKDLLERFNTWPANQPHPFETLPKNLETNRLPLYSHDENNDPIYNYAVARVRFRAPESTQANNVRVFFRLWTTGWTALEYDTNQSYRRHGDGASAASKLGLTGGQINNVPCFAEKRESDMKDQKDLINLKPMIIGAGANEVFTYFGCWLDFNQDTKLFPREPGDATSFSGDLFSIKELMHGLHQCLVAEIHYWPEYVIPTGDTPANNDNLSQRNIVFDESDNPGNFTSHLVHHTFEIKPSPHPFPSPSLIQLQESPIIAGRKRPDELVIDWGNLPRDSQVIFYMPRVDVDQVIAFASQRQGPGNLSKAGDHAIQCKVTDVGFIPIPGPFKTNIPVLLTIQLPPNIIKDQKFSIILRQVDGRKLRVIGTTQFDIYVKTASEILPTFKRNLAVLKHIALSIPQNDRWYPIFQRYLAELGDRIRAFGGDPDSIPASSTGGEPVEKRPTAPDQKAFTGKVTQIVYNCFGDFEGFVLEDCDNRHRFTSCEKSLEEVVHRACRDRLKITVYISNADRERTGRLDIAQSKIQRVVVHCC